jgi:hypothetical protein
MRSGGHLGVGSGGVYRHSLPDNTNFGVFTCQYPFPCLNTAGIGYRICPNDQPALDSVFNLKRIRSTAVVRKNFKNKSMNNINFASQS